MEAKETLSTRDLVGDRERDDETAETRDEQTAERDEQTAERDDAPQLFERDESSGYQGRWETIQTNFVDDPRRTVEEADELVAEVMRQLAESFAAERERLESQWGRGEDVSTEDLRVALQRYRSFFQRLLAA
jgi:hypothetical protein